VTQVDITIRAYDPDDAGSGVSWSGACGTAVAGRGDGGTDAAARAEPGQGRGDQDCGLKTTLSEHSEVTRVCGVSRSQSAHHDKMPGSSRSCRFSASGAAAPVTRSPRPGPSQPSRCDTVTVTTGTASHRTGQPLVAE
jgi:hypothetical protein